MRGGHRILPRYSAAVLWPRSTISILDMKRMLSKMDRSPTLEDQNSNVRFGSKADICDAKGYVRFTPESRHVQCTTQCLLRARSGLMQCSNWDRYSITSSARNRTSGGTVSPSWPAVLRFKTNSNRVGDSIGRTAGLVPCRIFAAITPARRYWARRFGP